MENIKIGSIVDYKTNSTQNFLKKGVVTGFIDSLNRVYVTWPDHGVSSIHIDNLIIQNENKSY